eukprot:3186408-Rhodomonas_salina.1
MGGASSKEDEKAVEGEGSVTCRRSAVCAYEEEEKGGKGRCSIMSSPLHPTRSARTMPTCSEIGIVVFKLSECSAMGTWELLPTDENGDGLMFRTKALRVCAVFACSIDLGLVAEVLYVRNACCTAKESRGCYLILFIRKSKVLSWNRGTLGQGLPRCACKCILGTEPESRNLQESDHLAALFALSLIHI